jgi:hypothetical protein
MINGFVIDINNENGIEFEIPLFHDFTLPDGLSIKIINSNYTYDSLVLMAKSKCFMGNGFKSSIITKIKIFNKNDCKYIEIGYLFSDFKVIIDGFENYITIVIPPFAKGLFQLMPQFD